MNILTYKRLLFLITVFILSIQFIFPQQSHIGCGNSVSEETISFYNDIKPQLQKFENSFLSKNSGRNTSAAHSINSIPIKAHVIRHSDGSGGISENDINTSVNNLNTIFSEAHLEFFICNGINYINDDVLCHFKKGDETLLTETNYVPDVINIYFTDHIKNNSEESICGYTENTGKTDIIVIKNDCAKNTSSLAHEMGHYFSLFHTQGNEANGTKELVDGSNCDTDGDGICDTPADPGLSSENMDYGCNYIGTAQDANGDFYTPDTQNIMSYANKICRTHFSQQQLARMYAFYMTTKSYLACPSFNANIITSETETCNESLTVNLESSTPEATNWQWDMNSDGIIDYKTKSISHTFEKGVYDVTLTVSCKSKSVTKTYHNLIKVGTQTDFLDEDFEGFTMLDKHGWSTKDINGNGYNWSTAIKETPSDETGPNILDNTFIYTEASNGMPGDVAEFISPCFNINYENSGLEFAYHMFGKNIGELHIDIKTSDGYIDDVIPPLVGSQQNNPNDTFKTKTIDLSTYAYQTIKVRFRAIKGNGWEGDIAIDDVFFKTIHTAVTNEIYKIYPNPVANNLLYIKNAIPSEAATFRITNPMGQHFISGEIINGLPIDVSHLSSGNYLLYIFNGNGRTIKRFVK
ncbi:T9SS type A sorting domain-containing protein [Flavobacteriaceae bacterium GSB9]|nr:T9SS type A sorting domain-containing protein [Flavobacteriaceae bacterium GSB9]